LLNSLPISGESGAESSGNNKVTIKEKDEICEAISKFIKENKTIIPNKNFYMSVCISKKVTKENMKIVLHLKVKFRFYVKKYVAHHTTSPNSKQPLPT
jgi:DeoR/GlpR family transcriptional regulator of sugar metabolism